MKKVLLISALVLISSGIYAQSNAIKVNILSPVVKVGNFQYERVISESGSIQLGVFYGAITSSSLGDDVKFTGFGITPEYRIYVGDSPAPSGFFVAPFARYRSFSITDDVLGDEVSLNVIGGGLIVGRQWLFSERVTFEVFIGPQYSSGSAKVEAGTGDSIDAEVFDGFGVRAGLTLGIAF